MLIILLCIQFIIMAYVCWALIAADRWHNTSFEFCFYCLLLTGIVLIVAIFDLTLPMIWNYGGPLFVVWWWAFCKHVKQYIEWMQGPTK